MFRDSFPHKPPESWKLEGIKTSLLSCVYNLWSYQCSLKLGAYFQAEKRSFCGKKTRFSAKKIQCFLSKNSRKNSFVCTLIVVNLSVCLLQMQQKKQLRKMVFDRRTPKKVVIVCMCITAKSLSENLIIRPIPKIANFGRTSLTSIIL